MKKVFRGTVEFGFEMTPPRSYVEWMDTPNLNESGTTPDEDRRWQDSLKRAFRSVKELASYLEIELPEGDDHEAAHGFSFLVTREFASRIAKGDPNDPLLLQVWPSKKEGIATPGFGIDPVGELDARIESGLMQKYHGRVLMVTTGACAIHCRYCFRRHYPYADEPKSIDQWLPALERIEADCSISEVILSGGDPLMITNAQLHTLVERIEAISHVERLRVHSRLPIVLPNRVDEGLLRILRKSRLSTYVVLHANHCHEIDLSVERKVKQLREAGAVVLNQAVLLHGVNDTVEELEKLCMELVRIGVLPYYLHLLDPVQGAAHFQVSAEAGRQLLRELRKRLPGYAMPEFVQEVAGEASKMLV